MDWVVQLLAERQEVIILRPSKERKKEVLS
jgi:hypothetical protein